MPTPTIIEVWEELVEAEGMCHQARNSFEKESKQYRFIEKIRASIETALDDLEDEFGIDGHDHA